MLGLFFLGILVTAIVMFILLRVREGEDT